MHCSREPSDLHAATLEAFYARVMQRVCSSYREEGELSAHTAIGRLQQKWQEKLTLYTGERMQSIALVEDNEVAVTELAVPSGASCDDRLSLSSSSSSSSASSSSSVESKATPEQVIGRPSAHLPSAATSTASSIFAKMLGGKRKLHQLDGSVSDDDEREEWQDVGLQEQQDSGRAPGSLEPSTDVVQDADGESSTYADTEELEDAEEEKEIEDDDVLQSSPVASTTSTSFLVSAENLAPVSGMSGINLPLQLAAEYTAFGHRGTRRGYAGNLRSIVLTWPSKLGTSETVRPGDLIWCFADSEEELDNPGGVVKVFSMGDTPHELKVELGNGITTTIQLDRVRRLKEYLIREGKVRFRGNQ